MNIKKGTAITLKLKSEPNFGKIYILLEDIELKKGRQIRTSAFVLPKAKVLHGILLTMEDEDFFYFWKILSK